MNKPSTVKISASAREDQPLRRADIGITGSYTRLDATEPAGIEIRRPKNQAAIDARGA